MDNNYFICRAHVLLAHLKYDLVVICLTWDSFFFFLYSNGLKYFSFNPSFWGFTILGVGRALGQLAI